MDRMDRKTDKNGQALPDAQPEGARFRDTGIVPGRQSIWQRCLSRSLGCLLLQHQLDIGVGEHIYDGLKSERLYYMSPGHRPHQPGPYGIESRFDWAPT